MNQKHTKFTMMKDVFAVAALLGLAGFAAESANAEFDIPTGAPLSPLFGAAEFSQKMLMFEEFGTQKMATSGSPVAAFPAPDDCESSPSAGLDDFLKANKLYPIPKWDSYSGDVNYLSSWDAKVKDCVPGVNRTYVDARPPGEDFAHQRWDEFYPEVFFQTALAGARTNQGLRDDYQMHHYNHGEFGPGGLYYNTVFSEDELNQGKVDLATYQRFNGTTKGIDVRFHPKMPVQDKNSVWTFDGTLSPKLLMAKYGEPILARIHNALPISSGANRGFGANKIATHEHNGHNPGESDGFTHAYSYPGQYYDYHWPMILAGHDSINTGATDPKAGAPDGNGGITPIPGHPGEVMSTHWFHDHMEDYTAQNVYKGNAAMMNYYSSVDRGREPKDLKEAQGQDKPGYACHYANPDSPNLCLPSGSELDWGNRDYDVNLLIADKAWDSNGQLYFNIFNTDGFLGDKMTVNLLYKPYLEVRQRRYRFRLLNAGVSRFIRIALVQQIQGTGGQYQGPSGSGVSYNQVPFYMIGNDGNLMEYALQVPNAQMPEGLPTQGIAERYDIVVDFSGKDSKNVQIKPGSKLYFVNVLEHQNGLGPSKVVALADILSGKYVADGKSGDPAVGRFLEFRAKSCVQNGQPVACTDLSMNPADYVEGKKKMVPRPVFTATELANARQRTFEFGKSDGTDAEPWTIKTDGGQGFTMDPHRVSAAPKMGNVEIWNIKNGGGGWSHPVHVHFEEGQVLDRDGKGPPVWEKWARKDVYRIGPANTGNSNTVKIAIRVREFAGTYVEHCHNTQHEDKAMLLRWDSEHPGQTKAIHTPMADWNGSWYEDSTYLPTAK